MLFEDYDTEINRYLRPLLFLLSASASTKFKEQNLKLKILG